MIQNSVQLIGYVGIDPIIKLCKNGSKKATLKVATHYPLKNQVPGQKYGTVWHAVVAWNAHAEYAERSFLKGSHILVNGSLVYRSFTGTKGNTRYVTEIKAHNLINLDR